jgi:hypothetical protein
MIIVSLILMLGGVVLYFVLTFAGFFHLYPVETYVLMVIGIWLAWRSGRRRGGWWRYGILGFNCVLLVAFVYWTLVFSQLPERSLSVSVGEPFVPVTLTDHTGSTFNSAQLLGKSSALYLFYRGHW